MCFIIFEFLLHNKVIESFKYPSTRVAPNGLLTSKFHYLALFREGRLHQKLGANALESVKIIHVDRVGVNKTRYCHSNTDWIVSVYLCRMLA